MKPHFWKLLNCFHRHRRVYLEQLKGPNTLGIQLDLLRGYVDPCGFQKKRQNGISGQEGWQPQSPSRYVKINQPHF